MSDYIPIPGFPGYSINRSGVVINRYGKAMKPQRLVANYAGLYYTLAVDKKPIASSIARLLLTAFVRPPEPGEVARHLNDNPTDDRLENLAWGSPSDNMQDARKNGKPAYKYSEAEVAEIRAEWNGRLGCAGNIGEIASRRGAAYKTIYNVIRSDYRCLPPPAPVDPDKPPRKKRGVKPGSKWSAESRERRIAAIKAGVNQRFGR